MPIIPPGDDTPAPLHWTRTVDEESHVEVIWHHVIPKSRLRLVWNAIVRSARRNAAAETRSLVRRHMILCGMEPATIDLHLARVCSARPPLDVPTLNLFRQAASFPPWDIVEGPRIRMDDPGADYLDRFTFGLPPGRPLILQTAEDFFHRIANLDLNAEVVPPATLETLSSAINVARPVLSPCREPIPYQGIMWERVGNGPFRKRRA